MPSTVSHRRHNVSTVAPAYNVSAGASGHFICTLMAKVDSLNHRRDRTEKVVSDKENTPLSM